MTVTPADSALMISSSDAPHIESYRIGSIDIDFFDISSCPMLVLDGRFYDTSRRCGNKEFSYDSGHID